MTPRNKRTGARCQTVKLGLLQRHRQRGKSTGLTKGHTWSESPTRVSRPPIVSCLRPRGPREKGDLRWGCAFPGEGQDLMCCLSPTAVIGGC